jgi:cytolysin-activating lysine-acyltransferase
MAETSSKQNPGQMMAVTGAMVFLARHSELHAAYRVAELMDRAWPSIMRGHYCLYTENETGKPVGFCNWLLVSEKVLEAQLSLERSIEPGDWDSGDIPFFPEMIAPFGHLRKIISDLRSNALLDVPWAYSIRGAMRNEDGTMPDRRVFKWKGRKSDPDNPKNENTDSPIRML